MEIRLQIVLIMPTPGVQFGLQKGRGQNYEVLQKQIAKGKDLVFSFDATVKGDRKKDPYPKLSGSFVQGPVGSKFVYIGIGQFTGQLASVWSRRLKVPLAGITWDMMNELGKNGTLQTMVPGTAKDGTPNCATVKPFDGWKVKND